MKDDGRPNRVPLSSGAVSGSGGGGSGTGGRVASPTGLARVAIALATVVPPTVALPSSAALAQGRAPGDSVAVLEGTVLAEGSGRPLPTAVVELVGQGRRTIADSLGRFRLAGLVPGPDTLRVALLEFQSERIPITIAAGGRHRIELAVAYPTATLEELVVEVAAARRDRTLGFDRRRRRGLGSFITREEIERRDPVLLSRLLWGLPRVHASPFDGRVLLDTRGAGLALRGGRTATGEPAVLMRDGGRCAPAIFVDGVKRFNTRVDDFRPEEVEAIEVYHPPAVPAQFSDFFNRCGSIVIWTRTRRPPI